MDYRHYEETYQCVVCMRVTKSGMRCSICGRFYCDNCINIYQTLQSRDTWVCRECVMKHFVTKNTVDG